MAFDFGALAWHQKNDVPGDEFTPIWNEYLRSGCTAKMTEEEALQSSLFFAGDPAAAVKEIADMRKSMIQEMVNSRTPYAEAAEAVEQAVPYEFLFIYMM